MPSGSIGIDFGTSNSAVVLYEKQYRRFTNVGDTTNNPIPSILAIDCLNQAVRCGRPVRQQALELRERGTHAIVESVKSQLGKETTWLVGQTVWSAERVATELFRYLSENVKQIHGNAIGEAVVAIPVGFNLAQRKSLRRAAQAAGIQIRDFVSEPTAAFMANARDLAHCRYVAVFDWGGGTLDISILEVSGDCIAERYTTGWHVAGDAIDRKLAEWTHQQLGEKHGLRMAFDNVAPSERQNLINQAEDCKCRLQQDGVEQQRINLGRYAGIPFAEIVVKKEDFDALIEPTVIQAVDTLVAAVDAARISKKEVGKLVIVGGSSKLKRLQQELQSRWPYASILSPPEADWHIAKGAALLAANPGCYRSAESLGVMLCDDTYHAIFPSGTSAREADFTVPFGIVEDSNTATFVLARKNGRTEAERIGELYVKTMGFRDEVIELECKITEDLVFLARGKSRSFQESSALTAYDELRWVYEIPAERR